VSETKISLPSKNESKPLIWKLLVVTLLLAVAILSLAFAVSQSATRLNRVENQYHQLYGDTQNLRNGVRSLDEQLEKDGQKPVFGTSSPGAKTGSASSRRGASPSHAQTAHSSPSTTSVVPTTTRKTAVAGPSPATTPRSSAPVSTPVTMPAPTPTPTPTPSPSSTVPVVTTTTVPVAVTLPPLPVVGPVCVKVGVLAQLGC
jgi:hypothetical protein